MDGPKDGRAGGPRLRSIGKYSAVSGRARADQVGGSEGLGAAEDALDALELQPDGAWGRPYLYSRMRAMDLLLRYRYTCSRGVAGQLESFMRLLVGEVNGA